MMTLLKRQFRCVSPRAYARLREAWNPWVRLTCKVGRKQNWLVATGPFAGMRYIDNAHGSRLIPKLVGSYESELHGVIARMINAAPKLVVDVGCAEGYYAVGFARALPQAKVAGFDISAEARRLCGELAELNGVSDRVAVEGRCDWATLGRLPLAGALVIVDCEGFELELLRPDQVPGLVHASILVELHDCFVPGLTSELLGRFEATHRIEIIPMQGRDPDGYPTLRGLGASERARAIDEDRRVNGRPIEQQWAFLEPHESQPRLAP